MISAGRRAIMFVSFDGRKQWLDWQLRDEHDWLLGLYADEASAREAATVVATASVYSTVVVVGQFASKAYIVDRTGLVRSLPGRLSA